jgi:hypothetical protein
VVESCQPVLGVMGKVVSFLDLDMMLEAAKQINYSNLGSQIVENPHITL